MDVSGYRATELMRDLFYQEVVGPNGKPRKRILIGLAGAMRGLIAMRGLRSMTQAGITAHHFDAGCGWSAGAGNLGLYWQGMVDQGCDMYNDIEKISLYFPHWWQGDFRDVLTLHKQIFGITRESLMRPKWLYGEYINLEALSKQLQSLGIDDCSWEHVPPLYVALSNRQGKHSTRRMGDGVPASELCRASASIAMLTNGRWIDGQWHCDGAHATSCRLANMIWKTIRKGDCVDVVILANISTVSLVERFIFQAIITPLRLYSGKLYKNTAAFDETMSNVTSMITKPRDKLDRIRMCLIRPKQSVLPFEWRLPMIRKIGDAASAEWDRFLLSMRPGREI